MLEEIFKYQNQQRENVLLKQDSLDNKYFNKTILITGGGGTIGQAIVQQLLNSQIRRIIIYDFSEYAIFTCKVRFSENFDKLIFKIGDVRNRKSVIDVLIEFKPDVVFHAAAYKHLELAENNLVQVYENNFIGTKILYDECIVSKVKEFILISTDKAVSPTSFMGLTKKMASYTLNVTKKAIDYKIIRFGNVIMSRGSLLPLIEEQILGGKKLPLEEEIQKDTLFTLIRLQRQF